MAEVSKRIRAIAERISYPTLADIGTDHGLLPIYALSSGLVCFAVASDVGPLEQARANAKGVGGIDIRHGDGLSTICAGEAETIVLAGMGGRLIIDILRESIDVTLAAKQLLLSPQAGLPDVRRYVHSLGAYIADEEIIEDGCMLYTIMDVRMGALIHEAYSEEDYELGVYRKPYELFLLQAQNKKRHYENILRQMAHHATQSEANKERAREIRSKLDMYNMYALT